MHCNNRDISALCWFITTSNRRLLITTGLLSKLLLESAPLETWREEGEGQGNRHRVRASSCVLDLILPPSHWWGNSKSLSNLQKVAQLANYRDNIQTWPESSQSPFLLYRPPSWEKWLFICFFFLHIYHPSDKTFQIYCCCCYYGPMDTNTEERVNIMNQSIKLCWVMGMLKGTCSPTSCLASTLFVV